MNLNNSINSQKLTVLDVDVKPRCDLVSGGGAVKPDVTGDDAASLLSPGVGWRRGDAWRR